MNAASPRALKRALRAFVFLFLGTLITHGHWAGSGDPVHYMMAAHSLVTDGDFDLADDYGDPANPVFDGRLERGLHALPGRGGGVYPVHDIGLPVLAAPFFALASLAAEQAAARLPARLLARARMNRWLILRQLLSLGMIGVACVLAGLLFDAGRLAGGTPRATLLWAALVTLSPPLLGHTFAFFTELPTATLALWLVLQAWKAEAPSPARAALLGFVAGLLVLIHARNAALAVSLALLLALRAPHTARSRAALGAGFAAALALRTYVTWFFWGTLATTPHASPERVGAGLSLAEMASRLLAWCFDVEHGLLPAAPLYALLIAGLVLLRRRAPDRFATVAWVALPYLLTVMAPFINRHGWRGGWSPAARFLVPIAPLLALGLLHALMSCPRWVVAALAALQCALNALFWARPQLLWQDGDGRSTLVESLGDPLALARWWPSWTWPVPRLALAAAIGLVLWLGLSAVLVRASRPAA